LKYASGKKLNPNDIYDRYDEVCGVVSRNVINRLKAHLADKDAERLEEVILQRRISP